MNYNFVVWSKDMVFFLNVSKSDFSNVDELTEYFIIDSRLIQIHYEINYVKCSSLT